MSNKFPVVSVQELGKSFVIYNSPWHRLFDLIKAPRWRKPTEPQICQALTDISLTLNEGEAIGVIGKNGSGKSTLLKILSGAMKHTTGSVHTRGRVASFLELGAGFHMEFTGRQNIAINAFLLGLSRKELHEKSEAIVAFSELGAFIDLPVRTYSSGMLMRLGFAVASHVEADVLIIDELLTVGDLPFQRKCTARISQLKDSGVAIILASHNMGDLAAICDSLIWLEDGMVIDAGSTEHMIQKYYEKCNEEAKSIGAAPLKPLHGENPHAIATKAISISGVRLLNDQGQEQAEFQTGSAMTIAVDFESRHQIPNPLFRIHIHRNDGYWVYGNNTFRHNLDTGVVYGKGTMLFHIQSLNLLQGDYYISVGIWPNEYSSWVMEQAYDVHDLRYKIAIRSGRRDGDGVCANPCSWELRLHDSV